MKDPFYVGKHPHLKPLTIAKDRDTFKGDDVKLLASMTALIFLDDGGAATPKLLVMALPMIWVAVSRFVAIWADLLADGKLDYRS